MTTTTGVHIVLDELVAQYIEEHDMGDFVQADYPDIYSHEIDGVTWFTDRFWILPADVFSYGDGFNIRQLPGEQATTAAEAWVRALATVPLAPSAHVFAPTFAGVLTCAGLSAKSAEGQPWEVLVRQDGERVGLIMPLREVGASGFWSAIPAGPAMIAMHDRIKRAVITDAWQCWHLAAHLTNEPA